MDHTTFGYAMIVLGILAGIGLSVYYFRPSPRLQRLHSPIMLRLLGTGALGWGVLVVAWGFWMVSNYKLDALIISGVLIGTLMSLISAIGISVASYVRKAQRPSRGA